MFNQPTHVTWKKIRYNFFSNLPYSALSIKLNPQINSKLKLKLYKFKWRNTIVSLRAPKHFKVGRQHYSQGKRLVSLLFINQETSKISNQITFNQVARKLYKIMTTHTVSYPLTDLKTVTIYGTVTVKLNKIL